MEIDKNKVWVIDIESNALLADSLTYKSFPYKLKRSASLWCVVLRNIGTNEVVWAAEKNITKEWLESVLRGATHLVAHNGIKFDFPMLKLFGILDYHIGWIEEPDTIFGQEIEIVDTIIWSRISNPDRFGGHGLEAWGKRLGNFKGDFKDFSKYSETMLEYCIQDTNVNAGVFLTLLKEMHPFEEWKKAVKQENKLADLAIKRESLGFWFNKDKAIKCVEDLTNKMEEIEKKVNPLLPPKPMNKGELAEYLPAKTQFKSDGTPSIHIIRFAEKLGAKIEKRKDSYCLIWEDKEFTLPIEKPLKTTLPGDITNLDHVKMYLLSLRVIKKEFEDLYTDVEYE